MDAKGNYIFDYYFEEHMGYSEPMVPIYSLPSDKRKDDIYEEDFDPEGYTVDVYNFEKYLFVLCIFVLFYLNKNLLCIFGIFQMMIHNNFVL